MYTDMSSSALWRMRTALKHHDRVREIVFEGTNANFNKILKQTQCAFPLLESLLLHFENYTTKLPDTFLRGPDLPDLHLRRLGLKRVSLDSISGFLLSATTVTDLSLGIDTAFGSSPEVSLLTCLQGMPCLRRLDLSISSSSSSSSSSALPSSTPKNIVPLSRLTGFHYSGYSLFVDALVAGLSAPSLLDVDIQFFDDSPPIAHLPRFINEIEEQYHACRVTFQEWDFRFLLQTQSEYINDCKPRFKLGPFPRHSEVSTIRMSGVLSAKLTTVEKLRVTFLRTASNFWENLIPWREFLQHFPRLKEILTEGANNYCIARVLPQDLEDPDDNELAFLPALEEIELGIDLSLTDESQLGPELAAFQPFVSARQQTGRPVKVFLSPYWPRRGRSQLALSHG